MSLNPCRRRHAHPKEPYRVQEHNLKRPGWNYGYGWRSNRFKTLTEARAAAKVLLRALKKGSESISPGWEMWIYYEPVEYSETPIERIGWSEV